ncbi:MAG: hypothetical protein ACI906_000324 [Candidatus Latescibacterota bacterium]|jgi:hypothetical protein|tara:strand:- start:1196 stop:1672 length:477 start_codon:yes stop_codon:yes gene_type:complete
MLKALAVVALAVGLIGCGGEEEKLDLIKYVNTLKGFDSKHDEIIRQIELLDDPSREVTEADLQNARQLIADYVAELEKVDPVEMVYRPLRLAYTTHLRQIEQATELAANKGNELRRERGNVAIGVRHIEKSTKMHFNAIDVLWLRQKVTDPFPLAWPE